MVHHHHRDDEDAALAAVKGYGTGSIAYMGRAAISNRDVGAAIAATRWAANRCTTNIARTIARRPGSVPLPFALAEAAGVLRAAPAYRSAQRTIEEDRPLLVGATEPDPFYGLDDRPPRNLHEGELAHVSVVIPTRGRRHKVLKLLDALSHQNYPSDKLDIIVSIDGDTDGTARAIRSAQPNSVRIIEGNHGGASSARNSGASEAIGELILFLDDDTIPVHDELLRAHARVHGADAEITVGPILPKVDGHGLFALGVRNWWIDQAKRLTSPDPLTHTDVCTGNLSVSRRWWEQSGGFTQMPRREDWDFGYRQLIAGARILPARFASVTHHLAEGVSIVHDRARERNATSRSNIRGNGFSRGGHGTRRSSFGRFCNSTVISRSGCSPISSASSTETRCNSSATNSRQRVSVCGSNGARRPPASDQSSTELHHGRTPRCDHARSPIASHGDMLRW